MFWQAIGAARDLSRAQDIAVVLIRYGFGDMVRRLGMADALAKAGKVLHWHVSDEFARLEPPARARRPDLPRCRSETASSRCPGHQSAPDPRATSGTPARVNSYPFMLRSCIRAARLASRGGAQFPGRWGRRS